MRFLGKTTTLADHPELDLIETIYDSLDAGDPAAGLALARKELGAGEADDPVLRFLAGVCLLELDRPAEAVSDLTRGVDLDPEDAEFVATLALAQFRCCRFEDAERTAAKGMELSQPLPDGTYVAALLRERTGEFAEADSLFDQAADADPERFPRPSRMSSDDFAASVEQARRHLPVPFRRHLDDEIVLIVDPLPADELLQEETPPLDPELLGLFVGIPLTERDLQSIGAEFPARIYLFKRNLERFTSSADELAEQIAVTLYHELGHYLGLDEDQLEELDFG